MIDQVIAAMLHSLVLAEASTDAVNAFSPDPWISALTGSGGALLALGMWIKTLLADRKDMVEQHKLKDRQLVDITREAIECIRNSITRSDDDEAFRERIEKTLDSIDDKLGEIT